MKLLNATNFKANAVAGWLDCTITIQREPGEYNYSGEYHPEELPFTYSPDDPHGAGPLVAAWIAEHNPNIVPYVAPPIVSVPDEPSPQDKLIAFLNANPDVKKLLS